MLSASRHAERGDTLVEVIFATAVLALVIVISLSIMNRGSLEAQRAVEGTFVRQEIDSQSELLRYARDAYADGDSTGKALWTDITGQYNPSGGVLAFDQLASDASCKPPGGHRAFWLKDDGSSVSVQGSFASPINAATAGKGVWIEETSKSLADNYLDFYLYACWPTAGSSQNATTSTIVRLYVPTS